MADFVAVLRKTIGGLGDTSPEMREKVFDKARATIEAKLAAIEPPPPAAVIERQKQALEEAIAVVRAEFAAPAEPELDDALESVLAEFDKPAPSPSPAAASQAATGDRTPARETGRTDPVLDEIPASARAGDPAADNLHAPARERLAGDTAGSRRDAPAAKGGKRRGGLIAAVLALVVIAAAAGGYVWWSGDRPAAPPPVAEAPAVPELSETETAADEPAEAEEATPVEEAAAPEPAPPAPAAATSPEKFTQRLLADGSEVDDGPAGGQPGIGEGSSVAMLAPPEATPADPAPAAPDAAAPATEEDGQSDQPQQPAAEAAPQQEPQPPAQQETQAAAVVVGQRAIFYEERTSAAEGSAETGTIAWSLVQESPGGDLPPEPAIRAEAAIPAKDVQLRMTIRRNGDATLPASHIVEMIFLTPDGFEGGAISNVSRIAFKDTEQAPGSPLIGIPAKIADGFFFIALSDAPAETEANLNLLLRQNWVDIPIVYQSGRRALLSLEKGIPGDRVFQEALRAWSGASSG